MLETRRSRFKGQSERELLGSTFAFHFTPRDHDRIQPRSHPPRTPERKMCLLGIHDPRQRTRTMSKTGGGYTGPLEQVGPCQWRIPEKLPRGYAGRRPDLRR